MFAKLFGPETDQLLVKLDTDDEGNPEVRVYCQPKELGVCSVALSWDDDSDESWNRAEAAFAKIGEKEARGMADNICEQLGLSGSNNDLSGAR